jgi:uncharacterized protein YbcI
VVYNRDSTNHLRSEVLGMPALETKGQLEAKIAAAITQFEREHLGRGPQEVRAWIIQDLILVRLKRVLTPAEEKLARDPEGRRLVKEIRRQLLEGSRSILDEVILDLTGAPVVSLHSDISVKTGERIIVFILAGDLEVQLRR